MYQKIFVVVVSFMMIVPSFASDSRLKVDFPPMMREHMLSNMRDHLLALQEITHNLSIKQFDKAAEVAEQRLGMSSMNSHGASHMGKIMPKEMSMIGTNMHKAASQFAVTAKDAEIDGGLEKAFAALSQVMKQCVACHSAYKVHD